MSTGVETATDTRPFQVEIQESRNIPARWGNQGFPRES